MKQQVFIIAGALIVLTLVLIWAYLLFFGTPEAAEDVFTDLGLSGEEDTSVVLPPPPTEEISENIEKPKLRQLTTKLVAGYREVINEKNIPYLYFVEKGTGHLYSINIQTGEETRLSATTIQNTYEASISPKGDFVAIAKLSNSKNMPLVLAETSTSSGDLIITPFAKTVRDFAISDTNELMYAETAEQGLLGISYNLETKVNKRLFTLPFLEAEIQWSDEGLSGSQFIFPKPTYALEGFLYEAKNEKLSRLPVSGFGLSAAISKDFVLYNSLISGKTVSSIYNLQTTVKSQLASAVVPEKCILPEEGYIFICGHEEINLPYEFPDTWYKGELSFKDTLTAISGTELVYESLVNTLEVSGREIDMIKLDSGDEGSDIYFINKNDNSLWVYEI